MIAFCWEDFARRRPSISHWTSISLYLTPNLTFIFFLLSAFFLYRIKNFFFDASMLHHWLNYTILTSPCFSADRGHSASRLYIPCQVLMKLLIMIFTSLMILFSDFSISFLPGISLDSQHCHQPLHILLKLGKKLACFDLLNSHFS